MMTTFDEREKSFEKKFAQDEEAAFKSLARRNRLLGHWAAEMMGKSKDDAAAYAKDIVATGFDPGGEVAVVEKLLQDLAAVGTTELDVRKQMADLLDIAAEQIRAGLRSA
jgi:hypothetical protein